MTEPTGSPTSPTPPSPPEGTWQPPSPTTARTTDFGVPVAAGPAPGVAYADLVQRIIAYIIDGFILAVAFWIVWIAIFVTLFALGGLAGALLGALAGGVLLLAGSAIYFIYTWTSMRASPGQRVLGLETVNAADGSTLSRDQATRRWLYLFGPQAIATVAQIALANEIGALTSLIGLASLIYYIYLLYSASQNPRRQGFHDVQSNTVVVKRI